MYTGTTEEPCCLCGSEETHTRIDLPPRAVQLMQHGDPIAWRDIESTVTVYFCADDWATVRDLVLETGMSPLSRCNVARASFDLREDFEALLNDVRDEPDQRPREREMLDAARETIDAYGEDDHVEERDVVEARIVTWALEDLGAVPSAD
jgi:hypothetical protein